MHENACRIALSVVVPVHNEQANVAPLMEQIVRAIAMMDVPVEIVIVDDGCTDDTAAHIIEIQHTVPQLRLVRLRDTPPGRGNGQSAAFHAGFRAARGEVVATLDGDLQNDPADLPRLWQTLQRSGADLVQGDRTQARCDGLVRRFSSWVGWATRRVLLGDTVRDTGCSLRMMRRDLALALPLEYRGMHRFIPLTVKQAGYVVVEVPVNHRQRFTGRSKYGIWNRALPGLIDCFAVRWMARRRCDVAFEEVPSAEKRETSVEERVPSVIGTEGLRDEVTKCC